MFKLIAFPALDGSIHQFNNAYTPWYDNDCQHELCNVCDESKFEEEKIAYIIIMPSYIFRQPQYDLARGQPEFVEGLAIAMSIFY